MQKTVLFIWLQKWQKKSLRGGFMVLLWQLRRTVFHALSPETEPRCLLCSLKKCTNKIPKRRDAGRELLKEKKKTQCFPNLHRTVNDVLVFLFPVCNAPSLPANTRGADRWDLNEWSTDANVLCHPRYCLIKLEMRQTWEKHDQKLKNKKPRQLKPTHLKQQLIMKVEFVMRSVWRRRR